MFLKFNIVIVTRGILAPPGGTGLYESPVLVLLELLLRQ